MWRSRDASPFQEPTAQGIEIPEMVKKQNHLDTPIFDSMLKWWFHAWWFGLVSGSQGNSRAPKSPIHICVYIYIYTHTHTHIYIPTYTVYIYIPANRDVRRPSNAPLTRFRALFAGTSFGFWTLFFAFFVASRASVHTWHGHIPKPNVTRVQSATQWTASVHTLHMPKPVM